MYNVPEYDGQKIRAARIGKRWSRAMVAKLAKVHWSTVYRLETQGRGYINNVGRVCDALGLQVPVKDQRKKSA